MMKCLQLYLSLTLSVSLFLTGQLMAQDSQFTVEIIPENISCFGGSDGSANVQIHGGTAPYTYEWSDGSTESTVSNLSAGLFSVTVTDSDGMQATACSEISQPSPLEVSYQNSESICAPNTGQASVLVSGGAEPYSILWGDGNSEFNRSDLSAGTYAALIEDANGCSQNIAFSIEEGGSFSLETTHTNVSCFGNSDGEATVFATGDGVYSYEWSNGADTYMADNLSAGIYNVTVTDGEGCSESAQVEITEPTGMDLSHTLSIVACEGASIDVTISGGAEPYSYYWSTGARTQDVTGLANGNYFLHIKDANGCAKSNSFSVSDVSEMMLTYSLTEVSCNNDSDGAISLFVSGGTEPFTYSWDHGSEARNLSGLSAGVYTVTVTDLNGCTASRSIFVPKDDPFEFEVNKKNVSCNGLMDGSISLTPEEDGDYTYEWSNGDTGPSTTDLGEGEYSVVITSPEGCQKIMQFIIDNPKDMDVSLFPELDVCEGGAITSAVNGGTEPYAYNWSNGSEAKDLTMLDPGFYKLIVTDVNGCKDSSAIELDGTALTRVSVESTPVTCPGDANGTARVSVSGNNGPYSIMWSNGSTSEDLLGLSKGTYNVTVTDAKGCVYEKAVSINEPSAMSVYLFKTNPLCPESSDGVIRSIVNGGTPPFVYNWNTGATGPAIYNLAAGNFNLTIEDKNGCTIQKSAILSAPEPMIITATSSSSCNGGEIDLQVSGGLAPHSFLWNDGNTAQNRNGLNGEAYSVKVSDANSCIMEESIAIPTYVPLIVSAVSNGRSALAKANGGVAPYTYLWSNGKNGDVVENLSPGIYNVSVTDAQNCTASDEVEIEALSTEPLSATIDCCEDEEICKGETARIPVHFTGAAPYTFTYSDGSELISVTTSENPYYIEKVMTETSTFKLVSIGSDCETGTVCGQATIGVNDCGSFKCTQNDYKAEVLEYFDNGDCRTVKMRIYNEGNSRYGLSHLTVSIPCGLVTDVSNSRGYKIEKGTDPTSGLNGFKIDDISNFGEAKDGEYEEFIVEYTICKSAEGCFGEFCPPLVAFKAATCVNYVESTFGDTEDEDTSDNPVVFDDIEVFPNPAEKCTEMTIKLPVNIKGSLTVTIMNGNGMVVYDSEVQASKGGKVITIKTPHVNEGIYLLRVISDKGVFQNKLSIR